MLFGHTCKIDYGVLMEGFKNIKPNTRCYGSASHHLGGTPGSWRTAELIRCADEEDGIVEMIRTFN